MRWTVVVSGLTLAFGLSVSGTVTHAQTISIGDVRLLEGNAGTAFDFEVTLSTPSASVVSVSWATADGTATVADSDYTPASGTVLFPALSTLQTVTVTVNGDTTEELDEVFYVALSGASGATLLKSRGIGSILDDDAVNPPVQAFSVVSDGDAQNGGRNRLQWFVPGGATGATGVVVRFNEGATCSPPATTADGTDLPILAPLVPDSTHVETHGSLTLDRQYCYSVWLDYGGGTFGGPETMSARPFDSTGSVKWKYHTSTTTLAAPTVGIDAVIVPSNDNYIHAMQRDPASPGAGTWPAMPWRPRNLGSPVQHRVPVIPLAGGSRAFVSTQDGRVHAVDTANGNLLWSTPLPEGAAQGAPAGIFTAFGGAFDYILAGTSAGGGDRLYALDPFTGAVIDAFPQAADGIEGEVGVINGMPTVDYANKRAYFASWQGDSGGTVWCLDLGPPSDALSLKWKYDGENVSGSPVLHNGRVYVADTVQTVWSHPAATGSPAYSRGLGDGEPKGFLFPDRRNNRLYVTTSGKVWAVEDTGSALNPFWPTEPSLVAPSVLLHHPGTDDIYVGIRDFSGDAAIVRVDASDGSVVGSVALEIALPRTIGASSLDKGFGMLYMGSEAGIIYAVELGF
jgi:outer membrane protein assembly factor BamB